MRGAQVLFLFHYTQMGGAERIVFELTEKIDRNIMTPIACCLVPSYKAKRYKGKYTVQEIEDAAAEAKRIFERNRVRCKTMHIRSPYDFGVVWRLVRFVREEKIRNIFCLDMQPERSIGLLCGAISRIDRFILSCHYDTYDDEKRRYMSVLDRFLIRFANKVTATSDYQKDRLIAREEIPGRKIKVIGNGVDVRRFRVEEPSITRESFGVGEGEKLVGIVARLVPCKGHRVFLEGAKLTLKRMPNTRFMVVGDGVERGNLEVLCKALGIEKQVLFLGSRTDIPELLKLIDVAVMSSLSENLPVSLLEYMAAEKPIVSTDVGGISEAITHGESGLLVEAGNPVDLANGMSLLLSDSEWAGRLARAARERVVRDFSIEKMVAEVERLFGPGRLQV